MFVELPVEEAYASLYAALQRLAIVLLAASIFAVLAGIFLARRMVGPIQALRAGAERIGGGDFSQRISIKTGDELEGLANQFNDMGARLQESYADLEKKVESRTAELSQSLDDLRTAQDRLIQTEKLASLGQLTAGIAHEIKNPLNFVNNFSALSARTDRRAQRGAESRRRSTTRPARRSTSSRTCSRAISKRSCSTASAPTPSSRTCCCIRARARGEHRPADINAIVEESLNLAYHGARAERPGFNITLKRDLDPAAGMVELYPQEITRVFLNLISNGFYAATKRKERRGGLRADAERVDQKPRQQGRNPHSRQRHRYSARGEGEDVQSVLHHQAGRRGYRPWPVDEPRHRGEAAWRHDRRRYRTGRHSPSSSLRCRASSRRRRLTEAGRRHDGDHSVCR